MRSMMKRWLWLLILIPISLYVWISHNVAQRRAVAERETKYQRTLDSYLRIAKLGTTRQEVEYLLKNKNVQFGQIYAVERPSTAYDDIIKIGEEDPQVWFCSQLDVYVAFEFNAVEPHQPYEALPSDRLKKIMLWRKLEGCL